jgi:hypothetical protein
MAEVEQRFERPRLIGYWIRSLDDVYFLPQEFVRPMSDVERGKVANYLNCGQEYEHYRGRSWCRFLCNRQMGSREYSDGRWVWPEDLSHYVRDHGVRLPEEFIQHVLAGVPPIPKEQWSPPPPDFDFWVSWCKREEQGRYRQQLADARRLAQESFKQQFAKVVVDDVNQSGRDDGRCVVFGCANKAMDGFATCAACAKRYRRGRARVDTFGELRRVILTGV